MLRIAGHAAKLTDSPIGSRDLHGSLIGAKQEYSNGFRKSGSLESEGKEDEAI